MQDKKNDLEEAADFDDMDFDDLEEGGDDFEEEWDDFDDGTDDAEAIGDVTDNNEAPPKNTGPQNKTFLQKNFNLIVIAIAALGGGGFILTQFGGTPPAANNQMPAATASNYGDDAAIQEIAELGDDLPPMPTPIEGQADEAIISDPGLELSLEDELLGEEPVAENTSDEGVLTPLPDFSESEETQLADLTLSEEPSIDLTDEPASILEDDMDETPALEINAAPLEAPAEEIEILEDMPSEELSASPELPVLSETPAEEPGIENIDLQETENAELATPEQDEMLKNAAETEARMSEELSEANSTIEQLKSTVASLEAKIETLEMEAQKAKQEQKTEAPAPTQKPEAQAQEEPPKETQPEPATTSKTKEKPASVEWVLRSAQPGKATVADKTGNGDMRTIEVGDTVPGIGKVQSIAPENGRWIVRGTTGTISQ